MWIYMTGKVIYILYIQLFGLSLVSLEALVRGGKWTIQCGYVLREKSSIYYTVTYLAYISFHWQSLRGTKNEHLDMDTYYRLVIHIYWSYILGLYIFSDWMCRSFTYLKDEKLLEYIPGFVCGVESQTDLNIDLTWNYYL